MLSPSVNSTQKPYPSQQPMNTVAISGPRPSLERDGLQPPNAAAPSSRNLAASAVSFAPRGSSLNPSPMPGSFSSDLRAPMSNLTRAGSRPDIFPLDRLDEDDGPIHEQTLAYLRDALGREMKIKEGSENMLEALNSKKAKQIKDQRQRVEAELNASNQRIKALRQKIADAQRVRAAGPTTPTKSRADGLFQSTGAVRSPASASRSVAGSEGDEPTESPTFALAEILQALEADGMPPDYYVSRANSLVDLFKRHPTLKYDLVWTVFGLRMQAMLLSHSREVVAAGYRMIRYAISDLASLQKIRALNTDYLVTWSLIKDRKADVEREQALKFVRAFLEVKDGYREISKAVVRTITAVAEDPEERLRPICLETLAEILVRDPRLLAASGGLSILHEALGDGSYKASESLTGALLYILDSPRRRQYLRSGNELEVLCIAFTDDFLSSDRILRLNAKAIATALKSWSGLLTLSMYNFRAIKSIIHSMVIQTGAIRDTIIDLLYGLLRIKSPGWATSFLAGRRLTTYGRVANLRAPSGKPGLADLDEDDGEQNFVGHYTALLLAVFVQSGLVPALLKLTQEIDNPTIKRKATLLTGEVLKLASRLLPPAWSDELQVLPGLLSDAAQLKNDDHFIASGVVYQMSSVSKTLYRSTAPSSVNVHHAHTQVDLVVEEQPKPVAMVVFDDASFRQLLIDSAVIGSSNYNKWDWDIILRIIEGPLTNGKRLEEAVKASKFMKRIISFYRPFKYKFSEIKSTRNSQKFVRVGCALMHTLLQSAEGARFLADSKLLRQIAECLAQVDPISGITAQFPLFAKDRLIDTLCGGYFPMLGVLSGEARGLLILDRWHIFDMMHHIVDLKQRPDLIKMILSNFDCTLVGHPRVLLSKALTAGTKDIRIHATNVLRKSTAHLGVGSRGLESADAKWAIQLLVTQLYDPDVEVCATAVKILEKACNSKEYLEYIVLCRPALDHLGEIGAPLLLRFLSTSSGYHYLDGLDYISNEMDDWFLGRNDSYVHMVEASLARTFLERQDDPASRANLFDAEQEMEVDNHVPPHFYRELTRTTEGCRLLRDKGHFDEFAATIRDYGMQSDDTELVVKVKGCLWAVGNVGSMELGAPFLESCDVVDHIVKIAQEHEIMSLRGTAFFVLGLISRSVHGLEILSESGWDSSTNDLGGSRGFCVPKNLGKLFSLKPWEHVPTSSIVLPSSQRTVKVPTPAMPSRPRSDSLIKAIEAEHGANAPQLQVQFRLDPDPTNHRILELIIDLANMVLYRKARVELLQLKSVKRAPGFGQPHLFKRVMALLESHRYRLVDRSMIVGLFDKRVLQSVVFDDDEEDSESEEENAAPVQVSSRAGRPHGIVTRGVAPAAQNSARKEEEEEEEEEEESEDNDDAELDTSGDEQRTERQRSISDPAELVRNATRKARAA